MVFRKLPGFFTCLLPTIEDDHLNCVYIRIPCLLNHPLCRILEACITGLGFWPLGRGDPKPYSTKTLSGCGFEDSGFKVSGFLVWLTPPISSDLGNTVPYSHERERERTSERD